MKEYTSPDGNVTVSTYSLVPSVLEVGTNLVCQAGNPRIPDSTLEDTWELKIHCKYSIPQMARKCKKKRNFRGSHTVCPNCTIFAFFEFQGSKYSVLFSFAHYLLDRPRLFLEK